MFGIPPSSYGNQPLAEQSQAAVPDASRTNDRNAASMIAQGLFSSPAWLASGLPSRRDDYVQNCLRQAAFRHAEECLGVSQEQYVRESVKNLLPQLPAPSAGVQMSDEQIRQQIAANAVQSWQEEAAPHVAAWESASDSEAYRQTQATAEETWNRLVSEHVPQLGRARPASQSSSVARQAGAASRAAILRDAWARRSGAANMLAAEPNVFDQAFGAAVPSSVALGKRPRGSSPDFRLVGGQRPGSSIRSVDEDDDGSEEMADLDLNNNYNQQQITASELRLRQNLVDDPENPGKQITAHALRLRQSDRQLVDDPENPGKQITANALRLRRNLVDDPENPGKQITASALRQRQADRRLVDDPENPGTQITATALRQRPANRRR